MKMDMNTKMEMKMKMASDAQRGPDLMYSGDLNCGNN